MRVLVMLTATLAFSTMLLRYAAAVVVVAVVAVVVVAVAAEVVVVAAATWRCERLQVSCRRWRLW